jgi:hypothetical protein
VSVWVFPFAFRYGAHSQRRFREGKAGQAELLSKALSTGRFVAVLVKKNKSFTVGCRFSIRATVVAPPSLPLGGACHGRHQRNRFQQPRKNF